MSSGSKVIVDFIFELAWAGVLAEQWLQLVWISLDCVSKAIVHLGQEMSKISKGL